jgi:holo-[acyl-carrier protein] synthase
MILGTGIDLVDIRRLEKVMENHRQRFQERYFTKVEIALIETREKTGKGVLALAKRYAAKEACAKALGCGFVNGVYMKDIEVSNDALGKPFIKLNNGALERLYEITPKGQETVIHLSLTDEPPYAQAQVIIEGI